LNFGFGVTRLFGTQQIKFIISMREDVFGVFTYKIEHDRAIPYKTDWNINQIVSSNEMAEIQIEMTKKANATVLEILRGEILHDF
jgi:hypothetical protein